MKQIIENISNEDLRLTKKETEQCLKDYNKVLIKETREELLEAIKTHGQYIVASQKIQGVSKKMPDSEIRRFRAHKSLLCLPILNGSFILDAKVCLGTTGNICVSLQCTL